MVSDENKTKLSEINIDSHIIFKINNVVILGFIIDKELKFNDHIEFICKKIGKNRIF